MLILLDKKLKKCCFNAMNANYSFKLKDVSIETSLR